MSSSQRVWRVGGSVLAAVALASGVLSAVTSIGHEMVHRDLHFDAAAIRTVEIRTDSGDVHVSGAEPVERARSIDLHLRLVHGVFDSQHTERIEGDRLVVEVRCNPFWMGVGSCDLRVDAQIPRDVAVVVTADNGTVAVRDTTGGTKVSTDNGDIDVTDVAGRLDVSTDNGTVQATELRTGDNTAHSDNGDISLTFAAPPTAVRLRSDNGDVEVVLPHDDTTYRVSTGSDNGDIRTPIRTDPSSGRRITATTDNGAITLRY